MPIAHLKKFIFENRISIFIFLLIGALTAVLYIGLFNILYKLFDINYQIALLLSYVLSVTFYFYVHRRFTFRSHGHPVSRQLVRFIIMLIMNYFITLGIVHFVVETLHLSPTLGIVISIGLTVITNYLIGKFWVFSTPLKEI